MTRIVVQTPREVRRGEDAFASWVALALTNVATRASLEIQGLLTAAAAPEVTAGVSADDVAIISGLWANVVAVELAPAVADSYQNAALDTVDAIQSAMDWTVPPISDVFAESYLQTATNRLIGIGDSLWAAARDSLIEGMNAGESIPELRDRVVAAAGVTVPRATVIARTEIIAASNAGSLQQVQVAGLVGTKEWLATNDARTRCTHRAADGQTVDLGESFSLGGSLECGDFAIASLQFPGDPTGPAGEIIQCRCSMAFDLDLDLDLPDGESVLTAAAEVHTGAMIALRMTEADARCLEVEGFEDADELHVTLAYLGDAINLTPETVTELHDVVRDVASTHDAFETSTFALSVFNPHDAEMDTAVVLGVGGGDSPLELVHADVNDSIADLTGLPEQHTPWVPHITLAYTDDLGRALEWVDRLGPITFDRLRLAIADDITDYPLGGQPTQHGPITATILTADADFEKLHPRDHQGQFVEHILDLPDVDLPSFDVSSSGVGDEVSDTIDVLNVPEAPQVQSVGKTVPKLTNAVIYGKYENGDVIATSQDDFTRVFFENGKIRIQQRTGPGGEWQTEPSKLGKAQAYKELQLFPVDSWVVGAGGNVNDVTPTVAPSADTPTVNAPSLGTKVAKIPASTWSQPWQLGDLIAESEDGETRVLAGKPGMFDAQLLDGNGNWVHMLSYTEVGAAVGINDHSPLGWTVYDAGTAISDPGVPPLAVPDVGSVPNVSPIGDTTTKKLSADIFSAKWDWPAGKVLVTSVDDDVRVESTGVPGEVLVSMKGMDGKWLTPTKFGPDEHHMIPSMVTEWFVPASTNQVLAAPPKKPSVIILDDDATDIVHGVIDTNDVISSFKTSGVKWHTDSGKMLEAAIKYQQDHPDLSLAQILGTMDGTTSTSTSPTPFTDKIAKYLTTKKGLEHHKSLSGVGLAAPRVSSVGAPIVDRHYDSISPTDADIMQRKMDQTHGDWTPEQAKALFTYTNSSYSLINGCLRFRDVKSCDSETTDRIDHIRAALKPLPQDVRVHRGALLDAFGVADTNELKKLEGKLLIEPGFVSTSVRETSAFTKSVKIVIDVPAGTPAAYLESITFVEGEYELLLKDGLKYRIKKIVQPDGYSVPTVYLEVQP